MSLYSALSAGVSGLTAQSSAMAGVADNITNINTVGYKGIQTEFKTLVVEGQSSSTYSAGGVQAAPRSLLSKQGLLQASSSATDMGIEGEGFFVTRASAEDGAAVNFTRSGSFTPDMQGYLRNSGGYYLQGWRLDVAGNYVNTGNLNELEPVRISDLVGTAVATTKIELRANLQSSSPVFTGGYTAGDMASGTVTPQFSRQLDVFDGQGATHRLTMSYVKIGTNQWAAEIYAVPATDVAAPNGLLSDGVIQFNSDGSLDLDNSTGTFFDPLEITWTNGASSRPIEMALGSDKAINGLTQFGSDSSLLATTIDGGMLGNLTSIEISDSGVVKAIFDDGTIRSVFQLPLATFPNPDALQRLPGNAYSLSESSGNASINRPGSFGSGKILANTLEASNVDIAQEFTNMIRFQRAYSASSKIISTVDEMLQELGNLKR